MKPSIDFDTADRAQTWYRTLPLQGVSAAVWCAACFGAGPAWAQAAATAPESRIAQVTLYPGSATVERVAKLAAGARKFTFNCLPASLDVHSLAVAADASVRIGELSVLNEEREATPACAGTALDARIRELEDKKALLAAETDGIQLVTGYLKGLTPVDGTATGTRVGADPKNLAATADVLRRTGQEAMARQHQLNRQREELERTLKPLLAERSRVLAGRARVVSVSVTLDAPRDAELRLTYQVNGPGWAPTYRALLDTRSKTLRLERQAQVAQSTGEDWLAVPMRLSTGQPRQGTTGAQPHSWTIGIAEPRKESLSRERSLVAPPPPPAPAPMAAFANRPAAPMFDVNVFDNAYATEFAVPQRIDLPSGGQRITVSLGTQEAAVSLLTRTSPLLDASAWLVAQLPQPEGVWPAGALQLYRDGAYVGADTLRAALKGNLSLSFGRDELVVVRVEPQKDARGSTGFVGSRAERVVARAYTVENRHKTAIQLHVLEASPVSVDEKVVVENKFSPTPEATAWNEQPGLVLWSMLLDPYKTARFSADYAIRYPKDATLQESR
jgi:uncharacterized protein (TIGR02231 family)